MNWEEMFPGRFLKSVEFKGKKPTLTIQKVHLEELPDDKKGIKTTGIVTFKETKRLWTLNRTNATALKWMFGPETAGWIGKRVCLWAAPYVDPFTHEKKTAIRVVGSPDIPAPLSFEARIGRQQTKFALLKTANGNGKAANPQPPVPVTTDGPPPDEVPLPGGDEPEGEDPFPDPTPT